jgi:hypothetical protein
MTKVSVMYPNEPGNHFDIIYDCEKHIPLVHQLVGPVLPQIAADLHHFTNAPPVVLISEVKLQS